MSQALGPGARFGRYRIDGRLGSGGMGVVYAATDTDLDRRVALKVMSDHLASAAPFRQRFLREATVLARLDSAHVIAVFDHGEHDGSLYMATQYVPGGDLGRLLEERGPLPLHLAAEVVAQLAEGLHDAHRVGIVHRDVKPSNALLRDPDAPRLHAQLCDFGVAHTEGSEDVTVAGTAVAGSWPYMAPERTRGEPGGPRSDLYSLGCLLWATLTGRPPYTGTDVEVAVAHVQDPVPQFTGDGATTAQVNAVLARALAKDPAERYVDGAAMATDLRALAAVRDPGFAPLRQLPVKPGAGRRRRRTVRLAAAGLALVLVGGGATAWLLRDDPDTADHPTWVSSGKAAEPPPVDPVKSDSEGDGLSDVFVVHGNDGAPLLLSSDGTKFARWPLDSQVYLNEWATVGDVNGDGASEILMKGGRDPGTPLLMTVVFPDRLREYRVPLGPGAGSSDTITGEDSAWSVADVDGDGRDDLVFAILTNKGVEVRVARTQRNGFAAARTWLVLPGQDLETRRIRPGDFDGDGKADLLVLAADEYNDPPRRMWTYRSNGKKFTGRASVPLPEDMIGDILVQPIDLNGDDCDDLLRLEYGFDGHQVQVWRSDCDRFFPVEEWGTVPYEIGDQVSVGDFDGDGREDLALLATDDARTPVRVLRSRGTAFSRAKRWANAPYYARPLSDTSSRYW